MVNIDTAHLRRFKETQNIHTEVVETVIFGKDAKFNVSFKFYPGSPEIKSGAPENSAQGEPNDYHITGLIFISETGEQVDMISTLYLIEDLIIELLEEKRSNSNV